MTDENPPYHKPADRSLMLNNLNSALAYRLTLLVAPEGYGKSSLLQEWVDSLGYKTTWISLNLFDNDPEQFFLHLVQSLTNIEVEIGGILEIDSERTQQWQIDDAIISLINALIPIPEDFVLVLDNYQEIATPEIHRLIELLLEFPPPQMHIVIASRSGPPLPLARLMVRRQLLLLELSRPLSVLLVISVALRLYL